MVTWSALRPILINRLKCTINNDVIKRSMAGDHRELPFEPSRWQWKKFKDYAHLYFTIGIVPAVVLTTAANVYVGPATLTETPKGYVPKYWEYYRSPVTRFIARYLMADPQQEYEKYLHHIFVEDEKLKIRKLEKEIKLKMKERNDYQAYYYRPVMAKYHRITRESADYIESIRGD